MPDQTSEQTPKPPESPTTGREPDFDDEPQESGVAGTAPERQPTPKRVNFQDEAPPPKPPRPQSPLAQAEATLIEAFPSIDTKVVRAVLVASGGQVEPAFNALMGMSDPSFEAEQPPARPPRRVDSRHPPPATNLSQIEQDELYARQLAGHYEHSSAYGFGSRGAGNPPLPRRRADGGLKANELYEDHERSFFDDDLPAIKESITKGFQETQKTFNKWITDVRKRLDGDSDEDDNGPSNQAGRSRQNYGPSQSDQLYGIRKNAEIARRSGDRERYDADPRVLGDDFTQLELHDNEAPPQQRSQGRPLANPDLFKPLPTGPTPQSGPVDEVDALYRDRTPTERGPSPGLGKGGKKWQPLTSVAPAPEGEDNDPFSLGDSDEEQDKKQDLRPEDTERLKKVASESEGKVKGEGDKTLEPAERSGSIGQKDKTAEDLLAGKKS